eukprot:gene4593-8583_t
MKWIQAKHTQRNQGGLTTVHQHNNLTQATTNQLHKH